MTNSKAVNGGQGRTVADLLNPKAAVPVLLFSFVFCLVIDNGFKFMTKPIAEDFGLPLATASLQATLAGIVIGIGAVVYAALADTISIRKLMIAGVIMVAVGSVIGFAFQGNWPMVLAGRIIQTTGLAAAETLYVIYVTKYLKAEDQKTYLGFSTSSFQLALLIGTLTSGIVATYISWTAMFLISLVLVFTIPFILKTVPEVVELEGRLDVFGLFLIGVIATCVMWFLQKFSWLPLALLIVGLVLFIWHVKSNTNAVVRPEFFQNARYTTVLVIVLLVYMVQLGYAAILLPYIVDAIHGIQLDGAAYILAPGYACAVVVGALSGKVGQYLSSRQTIILAISIVIVSLVLPAVFIGTSVGLIIFSMILFPCGFALMYAPLVNTAVGNIPPEKSGVAIGFYNLTINIAVPMGIALTAKLVDARPTFLSAFSVASSEPAAIASTILWILVAMTVLGMVIYLMSDGILSRKERAAAKVSV